jgi:hypothetical protein
MLSRSCRLWRDRPGDRGEVHPVQPKDALERLGETLGFLHPLRLRRLALLRGELPLVAGRGRGPAAGSTAAATAEGGVEADRSDAAGEAGTAAADVNPGGARPDAGPDSPR